MRKYYDLFVLMPGLELTELRGIELAELAVGSEAAESWLSFQRKAIYGYAMSSAVIRAQYIIGCMQIQDSGLKNSIERVVTVRNPIESWTRQILEMS